MHPEETSKCGPNGSSHLAGMHQAAGRTKGNSAFLSKVSCSASTAFVMISHSNKSTFRHLRRLWSYLTRRRRVQLALLLLVMLVSSFAELVSLGAVLPFLAVLTNPQQLWQQTWIQPIVLRMGYTQAQELVLPAASAFALAAVLAAVIRLLNFWFSARLAAAVGSDLSCKSYMHTLYQPYEVHVKRNSSTLISAMTEHINTTVLALKAFLVLISATLVSSGLLIGLLLIDWQVALITAGLFSMSYAFVAIYSRRQLRQNSQQIALADIQRLKSLQEGIGAIRDVLLSNTQSNYLELYRRSDQPMHLAVANNSYLKQFPRYFLEAIGLVVIAALGTF